MTAQGTNVYERSDFLTFLSKICNACFSSLSLLMSVCVSQAHHEARGPVGLPEGRNVSCFSHRSPLWHRAGRLLSWGRGGSSGFVRLTGTGDVGGEIIKKFYLLRS